MPRPWQSFRVCILIASAVIALTSSTLLRAADAPAGSPADEKAIRETAARFIDAFNRADAKGVAALWATTGTLSDESGEIVKGREAIEAKYAEFFKQHPGAKIEINIKSIEFPTPSVAIEDGVARVESAHAGPP